MTHEDNHWRKIIADRLRERNKLEVSNFNEIIGYSKFFFLS